MDATMGNGWDTLFLARLVGALGRVVAYDIQPSAIEAARRRLESEGLLSRCTLLLHYHADPGPLGELSGDAPTAVMFNLGYLPGGDKSITTTPETTVVALEAMSGVLSEGGVITVVAYRDHPGGAEEAEAVAGWMGSLDAGRFETLCVEDPGGPSHAPILYVIRKR